MGEVPESAEKLEASLSSARFIGTVLLWREDETFHVEGARLRPLAALLYRPIALVLDASAAGLLYIVWHSAIHYSVWTALAIFLFVGCGSVYQNAWRVPALHDRVRLSFPVAALERAGFKKLPLIEDVDFYFRQAVALVFPPSRLILHVDHPEEGRIRFVFSYEPVWQKPRLVAMLTGQPEQPAEPADEPAFGRW